ncbi:MAG: type II CAAX endopeptidase family protein [Pseudomonadota bacterium]
MANPYAAHDAFVAPGRRAPEAWRVALMIVCFAAVFVTSPSVFALLLPTESAVEAFQEGTTAFGTLAQFFFFGIAAGGLVVLLRLVHGRGFWSLIGDQQLALRHLILVTWGVTLWLLLLQVLPPWINPDDLAETRNLAMWVLLIPVTLVALLIQVGTEELFFRGYLQQQFAVLNPSPMAWMIMPSVLFGMLHFLNGQGAADGTLWAIWAGVLGVACADLTARTGTLGAAVGLHLANNAFALLIVAIEGWPASGVALFLYPYEDPETYAQGFEALLDPVAVLQLFGMLTTVLIMWLAARIALRV